MWRIKEKVLNGIYNDNINNYINRDSGIKHVSDAQRKYTTSPFNNSHLIDETNISNEAINLYEKEQDIKRFASLVISDESDDSHVNIMEQLFSDGVVSPFTDDDLESLLDNQKFLDDIIG